jgi:XTP/dITP diphosphohydrolase
VSDGASDGPLELVLATGNAGKLREVREILAGLGIRLVPLSAFPEAALPDEGDDYEANALAKARAAAEATGFPALADDSGIEVEALDGRPGPRSARFGGEGLDDAARNRLLLEALRDVPDLRRGARFVCVAALVTPAGTGATARGTCEGRLLRAPRGGGGFGYDPIFEPLPGGRAMAEIPAAQKNQVSHRARAFRALAPAIRRHLA